MSKIASIREVVTCTTNLNKQTSRL